MKYKWPWKDSYIRVNKNRHKVICIVITYISHLEEGVVTDRMAIKVETVQKWDRHISENSIALNYLVAAKYFTLHIKDGVQYITANPSALDAYNSDHFLMLYKEQIRLRNNNRWMIFFNGIVAFGVIYSIWKDDIKKYLSSKKEVNSVKQQDSKTLDTLKSPTYQDNSPDTAQKSN